MIKRKKILLFLLTLNLLSLTACIPDVKFDFKEDHPSSNSSVRKGETSESETSKRNSSSDHSSEQESHSETIPSSSQVTKPLEKLPLHASEALRIKYMQLEVQSFSTTRKGIQSLPKSLISKAIQRELYRGFLENPIKNNNQ